jgi:hypothetical protein
VSKTDTHENYQGDNKIKHNVARGVKCQQKMYIHTINNGQAVTKLVEALSYNRQVAGSIPGGVIGVLLFNFLI